MPEGYGTRIPEKKYDRNYSPPINRNDRRSPPIGRTTDRRSPPIGRTTDRRSPPVDNYTSRQSPPISNNDRYTPMPYENSQSKRPEIYYMETNHDIKSVNDQPPYAPVSSPPIHDILSSKNARPEFYHMKAVEDGNENTIYDRRTPPPLMTNNRVSPLPLQKSDGQGIEMYYIEGNQNNDRQSPPIHDNHPKPLFNNSTNYDDNNEPRKITTYVLTSITDEENLPPPIRTTSPPIRPTKKQPVAYDIVDDDHKYDVSVKPRPFPTALHEVPTVSRHIPLEQSKASESIRRSMNKYRFAGS